MRALFFSLPLYLLACGEETKVTDITNTDISDTETDADGDGFTAEQGDCDDDNAEIHPDATETCDGVDNDCDGLTDDDDDSIDLSTGTAYYVDTDGDGVGSGDAIEACEAPEGMVPEAGDCDDAIAHVYPNAIEICDGVDNDCDGLTDDDDDSVDTSTMMTGYADMDGDGEGNASTMLVACELPSDYVYNADDCDDDNASISSNAVEVCDGLKNQCNASALPANERDDDGDGFVECQIDANGWQGDTTIVGGEDCDDNNIDHHAVLDWYFDDDGDGFGDNSTIFSVCVPPPNGYVLQGNDCDDSNADTFPNNVEVCDGIFNDCNHILYAPNSAPLEETDNDGDGYVECAYDSATWQGPTIMGGEDCDDSNGYYHAIGEWHVDNDGDGFGNPNAGITTCVPPSSIYKMDNSDCNDSNAQVYVGAPEVCDGVVNDCNSVLPLSTNEVDNDGDGFVECSIAFTGWRGSNTVVGGNDCDDNEFTANPIETEICDGGIDNDCDGLMDDADDSWDATTGLVVYTDSDGDGQGDLNTQQVVCIQPVNTVLNAEDCNDDDASVNTLDEDNDTLTTCGEDSTGDGYLDRIDCDDSNALIGSSDEDGDGFIACVDDCNDEDPNINPMDNDGDGLSSCDGDCNDNNTSIGIIDLDGDGFSGCINDCDDSNPFTYPGAAENEADPTLCLEDRDGDGYGNYVREIALPCLQFEMHDTYGDSWNGNAIQLYEDGSLVVTFANENLDGVNNNTSGGETQIVEHCVASSTTQVDLVFIDGSFNNEVQLTIFSEDITIGYGEGGPSTSSVFSWEDTLFSNGDTFFSFNPTAYPTLTGGTDCDDRDSGYTGDEDGDGSAVCIDDCDDDNPNRNPNTDGDGDGFTSCDDCNDNNAAVNPDGVEVYYDGIDQDCSGGSDYDQDGDGYEVDFYYTSDGIYISHGGGDCNDTSSNYHPLENETDTTACYYDSDGDGFGTMSPSTTAQGYGVIAGTDCYDYSATTYPGAAYNEPDIDGDGEIDCSRDVDGDGFAAYAPLSTYNAMAGSDCDDSTATTYPGAAYNEPDIDGDGEDDCTEDADGDGFANQTPSAGTAFIGSDCDDSSELISPEVDEDGDGVDVCSDCDDSQSGLIGGLLYEDADGDGFGDIQDTGFLTCDLNALDSDGDGINDLSPFNTDCNDNENLISPYDNDGDGYAACPDANGLADCDDDNSARFPGAGYNEASFNPNDFSTYTCQTDGDGDGYATITPIGCFDFTLFDTYGDGWNNNTLDIYEDGVLIENITNQNLDGINNNGSAGEYNYLTYCVNTNTQLLEIKFTDGTYNNEVQFQMYNPSGVLLLNGQGGASGSAELIVNGVTYLNGATIYSVESTNGTDADDNNPNIH